MITADVSTLASWEMVMYSLELEKTCPTSLILQKMACRPHRAGEPQKSLIAAIGRFSYVHSCFDIAAEQEQAYLKVRLLQYTAHPFLMATESLLIPH